MEVSRVPEASWRPWLHPRKVSARFVSSRPCSSPISCFLGLPGGHPEPSGGLQSLLEPPLSSLDSPPEDPLAPGRSRARRLAGLKTGPWRLLAAQSLQNQHRISSNPNTKPSKALATFPDISGSATELEPFKNVSGLSSGLRIPDSGLPTLVSLLKYAPYKR